MISCFVCGREAPPDFKTIEDRPVVYCHDCFAKGGNETAPIQRERARPGPRRPRALR